MLGFGSVASPLAGPTNLRRPLAAVEILLSSAGRGRPIAHYSEAQSHCVKIGEVRYVAYTLKSLSSILAKIQWMLMRHVQFVR